MGLLVLYGISQQQYRQRPKKKAHGLEGRPPEKVATDGVFWETPPPTLPWLPTVGMQPALYLLTVHKKEWYKYSEQLK